MDISSRTSEGGPCRCPVCGKVSIVEVSAEFADSACSHCGSLIFPQLMFVREHDFTSDDEKRLASLGVVIETDDQGEITKAKLCGPRVCDRNVLIFSGLDGIPLVQIDNTSLSKDGKQRLTSLLKSSIVEDLDVS